MTRLSVFLLATTPAAKAAEASGNEVCGSKKQELVEAEAAALAAGVVSKFL